MTAKELFEKESIEKNEAQIGLTEAAKRGTKTSERLEKTVVGNWQGQDDEAHACFSLSALEEVVLLPNR